MYKVTYQVDGARRKHISVKQDSFTVGSGRRNTIVLKERGVARQHFTVTREGSAIVIDDMGSLTGTWVNRERIVRHEALSQHDEITIGNVRLWIDVEDPAHTLNTHQTFGQTAGDQGAILNAAESDEASRLTGRDAEGRADDELIYWGKLVHDRLIEEMDLRRKDVHSMSDRQLRQEAETLLEGVLQRLAGDIPDSIDPVQLRQNVLNEAVGLGPLERLLADETVTEIMVNNHDEIFYERDGKLLLSTLRFSSDYAVMSVIERIITPLGRRIDESSPMVDARLKDGSRVNAIIPPLAIRGPSLTIRKFASRRLHGSDLVALGSINDEMVEFLRMSVKYRKNIVVSGGTGSGKTTLLNVLSNFIPDSERIVTIEDAAELRLVQPNLVSLEARPANLEGRGQVTIRDLVKNSLRMRPDRIVVGECRGGEALDMLQAMNTGHDGSLTTAHANSPRDALSRLEVMVLMAGMDLPVSAIREQIASAIDIIVQQTRFSCGSRKITKITEIVGIESGTIQLQDIFAYKQEGTSETGQVRGRFEATGIVPTFYENLARIGAKVDLGIFRNGMEAH